MLKRPRRAGNITLLTQPLTDIPGREVRITELDRDPLEASAPHRHPGHHTFGYIAEGTYEFGVNGSRRKRFMRAMFSMNHRARYIRFRAMPAPTAS